MKLRYSAYCLLSNRLLQILAILVIALIQPTRSQQISSKWVPTQVWGNCSVPCGPGTQQRLFVCVQEDRYNTTKLQDERFCGQPPTPDSTGEYQRNCDFGDCYRRTRWRVSEWSNCSYTCGPYGRTRRQVDCVTLGDNDEEIAIDQKYENTYCDLRKRPESSSPCNRFNCPAEFHPMEWLKCEQNDPCKSGFQSRKLACKSLGTNGVPRDLPMAACYLSRKRPPTTWRRCFLEEKSSLCTKLPPVIDEVKMVVVQMREVRRMRLQVGQEAYILPGTHLSIRCPVKFFPGSNLIWRHTNHPDMTYTGHPVSTGETYHPRFVGKSGNLVIRRFSGSDAGEWRCHAGTGTHSTNASIILHYNLPSQGLSDWVARNARRNTEMQNEDPHVVMTRQKVVQWVEGEWSNCSVPCGGQGVQTRTVRCELLDAGIYHVLDDKECENHYLVKPKTHRVCSNLPKCPSWQFKNADYSKCTDVCVKVGLGTFGGYFACMLSGSEIPSYHCENMTKPDITCANPSCEVKWIVSDWSACSVSCGGSGFRYRTQQCIWANTGKPAASACYDAKIEAPPAVEKCTTKPCQAKCVDLSPQCSKYRHWCGFPTFKYNCCATCRDNAADYR